MAKVDSENNEIKGQNEATCQSATQSNAPRQRRRPLRLPFDGRKQDVGSWAYDHRIGLCITVIAYLLFAIIFVVSKIVVGQRASTQTLYIDMQTVELLETERDRLEAEVRRANSQIDWSSIRNTSSNENALNENLKDAKGTDVAALNSSAEEMEARMRSNREAYERGLAEAEAAGRRSDDGGSGNDKKREDVRAKGRVTVSFSLTNPVRYSRHLIKPAYRCEGGGEVIVNVIVNQRGEVVSAWVESGGDECMRQTAISAARGSFFDSNSSAPSRQQGTITYIFIPQ